MERERVEVRGGWSGEREKRSSAAVPRPRSTCIIIYTIVLRLPPLAHLKQKLEAVDRGGRCPTHGTRDSSCDHEFCHPRRLVDDEMPGHRERRRRSIVDDVNGAVEIVGVLGRPRHRGRHRGGGGRGVRWASLRCRRSREPSLATVSASVGTCFCSPFFFLRFFVFFF